MPLIDLILISIGCWFIGDYSSSLGWGLWFVCFGFFNRSY